MIDALSSVGLRWLDIGRAPRDEVEVHKNAKKGRGQYPVIFIAEAWSLKDLF